MSIVPWFRPSAASAGAHTPQLIDRVQRMDPHLRGDDQAKPAS